jgi:hypothetical protein
MKPSLGIGKETLRIMFHKYWSGFWNEGICFKRFAR